MGVQPGPARLRMRQIRSDLAALNDRVDVSVVLVHWGRNYRSVAPRQQRLARTLRDAGAGAIVGHHPHIAQNVTMLGDTPVMFSLGNAALGTPGRFHSGRPPYGLVALLDIDGPRVTGCTLRLFYVDNAQVRFRPEPAHDPASASFLHSLVDPSLHSTTDTGGGITIAPNEHTAPQARSACPRAMLHRCVGEAELEATTAELRGEIDNSTTGLRR